MHLLHTTSEDFILKILKDGYLKSSRETKNVRMFGHEEGTKYIFLRLDKRNDYGTFILDNKLLLENNFYLKIGWSADDISDYELYNGDKLNATKLKKLIKKYNSKVNYYIYKNKENTYPIMLQMSNEILCLKKISLQKYLLQINLSNDISTKQRNSIIELVSKYYPDTIVNG